MTAINSTAGDHQQLQPSTAVHRLAEEFRMEVSLFERLVRNEINFVKLREQHRMRDEFLPLLVPHIYENYYSHSDVSSYPAVRGRHQPLSRLSSHLGGEAVAMIPLNQ